MTTCSQMSGYVESMSSQQEILLQVKKSTQYYVSTIWPDVAGKTVQTTQWLYMGTGCTIGGDPTEESAQKFPKMVTVTIKTSL